MIGLPPLWLPDEQAYTPDPPAADEQAHLDLHGPQPQPRAYRTTVTVRAPQEYL